MLVIKWTSPKLHQSTSFISGWSKPEIIPYGPIELEPSASALQYGVSVMALPLIGGEDGKIRMFRPELNMNRLLASARRIALPEFDTEELLKCIKKLILVDAHWVPSGRGTSLYIRPTIIGTHGAIGVGEVYQALAFVICSPAGPYFDTDSKAISLKVESGYVRSWPGGTGMVKYSGNYAPGILPQVKAKSEGYQQLLWVVGDEKRISEAGTMNIFFLWETGQKGLLELATPSLEDGTVLPGIIRLSILEIIRENPNILENFTIKAAEKSAICISDLITKINNGEMREIFGTGTAASVCPISRIYLQAEEMTLQLKNDSFGPLSKKLLALLQDIYHGKLEYRDWCCVVE